MGAVKRDATARGKKYSYTYPTLGAVLAEVRPALAEQGLGMIQMCQTSRAHVDNEGKVHGTVEVQLVVLDDEGQVFKSEPFAMYCVDMEDPQAVGSVKSYARRYQIQCFWGLAAEDDDGAAGRPQAAPRATDWLARPISSLHAEWRRLDPKGCPDLATCRRLLEDRAREARVMLSPAFIEEKKLELQERLDNAIESDTADRQRGQGTGVDGDSGAPIHPSENSAQPAG